LFFAKMSALCSSAGANHDPHRSSCLIKASSETFPHALSYWRGQSTGIFLSFFFSLADNGSTEFLLPHLATRIFQWRLQIILMTASLGSMSWMGNKTVEQGLKHGHDA
jgi:hypothetical protein